MHLTHDTIEKNEYQRTAYLARLIHNQIDSTPTNEIEEALYQPLDIKDSWHDGLQRQQRKLQRCIAISRPSAASVAASREPPGMPLRNRLLNSLRPVLLLVLLLLRRAVGRHEGARFSMGRQGQGVGEGQPCRRGRHHGGNSRRRR